MRSPCADVFIPLEKRVDTAGLIDPDTYPGRDPNRTPMQWDASQHAGFTPDTVEPWLPVNANRSTINVAVQAAAPNSTLTFYTTLLHLRRKHRALRVGGVQFLEETGDVLAYVRTFGDERLLIAINFGSGSPILKYVRTGRSSSLCALQHAAASGRCGACCGGSECL